MYFIFFREDPRDALVIRKDLLNSCTTLKDLKDGSVIGTSSLRRTAQLNRLYPNLKVENIRGNLNTRLKKLDELNIYSGIVLAKAGLSRMGWSKRISQILDSNEILYCVGQGALAVECRENDQHIIDVLSILHDPETLLSVLAERSFLRKLGGGCSAPVAVTTTFNSNNLELNGAVWSLDGKIIIKDKSSCLYAIEKHPDNEIADIEDVIPRVEKQEEAGDSSPNVRKCPFKPESPAKKLKTNNSKLNIKDMKCPYSGVSSGGGDASTSACPISSLPIGVDFMGKCPYLDNLPIEQLNQLNNTKKCPVNAEILVLNSNTEKVQLKCPYFNDNICTNNTANCCYKKAIEAVDAESKTFCGLIGSKFISTEILKCVENLGTSLAEKLIERGAKGVMDEAQSHIRGVVVNQINKAIPT